MLSHLTLFAHFPKATHKRYRELLGAFSSLPAAWDTEFDALRKIGWDEQFTHEWLTWRDGVSSDILEKELEKHHITTITLEDAEYPSLLKEIHDPPLCLFIRGTLDRLEFPLAVVGTRAVTPYGRQVTEDIVSPLAANGITIVSGLALGVDGIAHDCTIRAGGKTIAVLGGGCDDQWIYPRAHTGLARRILDHGGALVTEYPPGTMPTAYTFPRRNRIIAGLTLGTLVTEAGEGSGSLITSQCALDNGREVFAIPHPITSPTGTGPNQLLRNGATMVVSAGDILDALHLRDVKTFVENTAILPSTPTEAAILALLSRNPTHINDVIKKSRLESGIVTSTLTIMEMKGMIRNLGGMMYVTAR